MQDEAESQRSPDITPILLAEYEALRQESEQARVAQQTILNWSFGSLSVLVAAGVSQLDPTSAPHAGIAVLFGVAIPMFLTAAALIWIGELARMERVGYFLRRWERLHWFDNGKLQAPIWENFLAFGPKADFPKHWATYIGGAMLFGGGVGGSLVLYWMAHDQVTQNSGQPLPWLASQRWATVSIVIAIFLSLTFRFGIPVALRGRQLASKESLMPSSYKEEASGRRR